MLPCNTRYTITEVPKLTSVHLGLLAGCPMVWFGRHYIAWAQYLPCAFVGLCIPYMVYFTQPRLQKAQLNTAKAAAQTTAYGSTNGSLGDAVSYTTSYLLAQASLMMCATYSSLSS